MVQITPRHDVRIDYNLLRDGGGCRTDRIFRKRHSGERLEGICWFEKTIPISYAATSFRTFPISDETSLEINSDAAIDIFQFVKINRFDTKFLVHNNSILVLSEICDPLYFP